MTKRDDAARRAVERAAEKNARDAWQRGQDALRAGDAAAALRWLDRACRISPQNPTLRLGRATALLSVEPGRAVAEFADLAACHDVRDAWLGLAAARLRIGDRAGAATAMGTVLSRHAAPDDRGWVGLADAIAPTGWCALTAAGVFLTGRVVPNLWLDDHEIRLRPGEILPARAARAHWLRVGQPDEKILGSPIDLASRRRLEGVVGWDGQALTGWAWHPADPRRDPVLFIRPARGRERRVVLTALSDDAPPGLLAQPRQIFFPARAAHGPFRVRGLDGRELAGSPVDPAAEAKMRMARQPPARIPRSHPADIVIPVYRDLDATMACLASVFAHRPRGTRVIVIDDASPEPALATALDRLAARRRITLIRHARNRGFPAAANQGLARARADGHDALLLNADTLVGPGFLSRLRDAAYAAADIGTASALSNNATILSYPNPAGANPMPDTAATAKLAALAWQANGAAVTDIPTAVGFCMVLRHDCLRATGLLDTKIFARGYGEENDFCARATVAGWRHVAATGVFVAHAGEISFGAQAAGLRARNSAVLARRHPDYFPRVAAFVAADPLRDARRRIDIARWHASRPAGARAVLLITHAHGGGVARSIVERCAALRAEGIWPVVLAPDLHHAPIARLEDFPNVRFHLPDEADALIALLRTAEISAIEFHHLLGHHKSIAALHETLGVPHRVVVHDYHWFCPRLVLSGAEGRYCGEPDLAGCQACIRQRGSLLGGRLSVSALRDRSAKILSTATDIITQSADAAARMARHFPHIRPHVAPPTAPELPPLTQPRPFGPRRIAVVGALGAEKGFFQLLALARAATDENLPLEFIVIGHTIDDAALLRTGRAFITGRYQSDEAVALIRAQQADLALLPSIVPETHCHTLTEAWQAGLGVVAFDLGAPAERIRATGRGRLLPPGLPPATINQVLLATRW